MLRPLRSLSARRQRERQLYPSIPAARAAATTLASQPLLCAWDWGGNSEQGSGFSYNVKQYTARAAAAIAATSPFRRGLQL